MPKHNEKGFTLIELLIVVAILGVLTAIAIPTYNHFFGSGTDEARKTEKLNVQLALDAMMLANSLSEIPNPVSSATAVNDMNAFPDTTSNWTTNNDKKKDPNGTAYATGDTTGYLLYGHDETGGGSSTTLKNYMNKQTTTYYYTIASDGTVTQYGDAAKTITYSD